MEDERPSSYPLRMPSDMRAVLEAKAKESGRSLHQELLVRLEESLREDRPRAESPAKIQANLEALALMMGAIAQKLGIDESVLSEAKALEALPSPIRTKLESLRDSLKSKRN